MANTKISQLTANTNPTGNEELVYALNNANGKMTLNTMKTFVTPDLSGYQQKLISGVNIKTVNNYSLLGSGNIEIQGGGGGGQILYDAIVDASGNGDYTTLGDALQAGMTSIYIKNGTYTESPVEVTDNNFLIVGETEGGVILNYQTTSSNPYCIKMQTSTKTAITDYIYNIITGVTINLDMQSGSWTNVVNADNVNTTPYYSLNINHCTINAVNNSSGDPLFSMFAVAGADLGSGNKGNGNAIVSDCLITLKNGTATNVARFYDNTSSNSPKRCVIKDSKLYIINDGSGTAGIFNEGGCRFDNCEILVSSRNGTGNVQIMIENMVNCIIDGNANTTGHGGGEMYNCKGCNINFSNFSSVEGITGDTAVSDWAANTAYNLGDYVRNSSYIWKCTEAHTSGDTIDYDKFEAIETFRLYNNNIGCSISNSSGAISIEDGSNVGNTIVSPIVFAIKDNVIINGNRFMSIKVLKLVGKGQIVSNNVLTGFGVNTSGLKGIYYADNYNIIKDNILTGTYTPGINIVGTTTNTSKVSDNVIY